VIPVSEPLLDGREKELLTRCIDSGWISSEGPFVTEFERGFSHYVGTEYGVAVCSGTAALETALYALAFARMTRSSCLHSPLYLVRLRR